MFSTLLSKSRHCNEATLYFKWTSENEDAQEVLTHFEINEKYYDISTTSLEDVFLHPDKAVAVDPPTYIEITQTIDIRRGTLGDKLFYIVDDVCYDISFPLEWATNHIQTDAFYELCGPSIHETGCNNCAIYGSVNGVFVSYCMNCTTAYDYMGMPRGNGVLYPEDNPIMINATQNKLGYCEGVSKCFTFSAQFALEE